MASDDGDDDDVCAHGHDLAIGLNRVSRRDRNPGLCLVVEGICYIGSGPGLGRHDAWSVVCGAVAPGMGMEMD